MNSGRIVATVLEIVPQKFRKKSLVDIGRRSERRAQ